MKTTILALAGTLLALASFIAGPGHFTGIDLAATACIWTALLTYLHKHLNHHTSQD